MSTGFVKNNSKRTRLRRVFHRRSRFTNLNFVVFANGHRLDVVFAPQFFGQRCGHNTTSDVRGSSKMLFARLASRWRFVNVELHTVAGNCKNKTTRVNALDEEQKWYVLGANELDQTRRSPDQPNEPNCPRDRRRENNKY